MNKFRYSLYKFMQGRYGIDELYKFLFFIYVVILIINIFVISRVLTMLELLLLIVIFYRTFSKNKVQRIKENKKYLELKNRVRDRFVKIKKKWDERETKIYKKCPKCKVELRLSLPSKRGIKHVTCPKCGKKITMLCLRKEKIEVIVKKKKVRNI